jgi:hypothetical protein
MYTRNKIATIGINNNSSNNRDNNGNNTITKFNLLVVHALLLCCTGGSKIPGRVPLLLDRGDCLSASPIASEYQYE